MKIKKSYMANLVGLTTIIFSILLSKTVYFGIINRELYQYVYFGLVIFTLLWYSVPRKKVEKGILTVFPFLLLMLFNLFIHWTNMTNNNVNQLLGNCLYIISAMLIALCIKKQKFAFWYIKLMSIMCAISLPCWLLTILNPKLAVQLCQSGYDWTVRYGYAPFYTWGWNGFIFTRNSGMFWEPGAFQGFIFVAMLMLLFNVEGKRIKHRKALFILLIVTLLTTQSTTGYILVIMTLVICWDRIQQIFGEQKNYLRVIISLILGIGVIYIIWSSKNIATKFGGMTSDSFSIRLTDIIGGIMLSIRGGIIGLGETVTKDSYKILLGVNKEDSAGLLAMIYTYGLVFGGYYIGLMFSGIKKFFRGNIKEYVFLISSFFVLHLTEGLWILPIYLLIIFVGILDD